MMPTALTGTPAVSRTCCGERDLVARRRARSAGARRARRWRCRRSRRRGPPPSARRSRSRRRVQPPSAQSVRREADEQRRTRGSGIPHRIDDAQEQARAVLERAAVLVGAQVRQRREELVQQVAVRGVDLERSRSPPRSRGARRRRRRRRPRRCPRGRARPARRSPRRRSAEGATVGQPPSPTATLPRSPENGDHVEALRPAWPSWIAGTAPRARIAAAMGAQASRCSSFQMPVSSGEMRPSGRTAVASAITMPAPPDANCARCVWCHSCGTPSTALYWHIGATHRRLRAVRPRIVRGREEGRSFGHSGGAGGG